MKVYLSGHIGNVKDYAFSWRKHFQKLCMDYGIETISPQIYSQYFNENLDLVVLQDLKNIERSDIIVVNIGPSEDTIMTGTICEVFYASKILHLPIIGFVLPGEKPTKQFKSPWFGQFFTPAYKYYNGFEELIEVILEWKRALNP